MNENLTNAKTYLNQARLLDQQINAKLERIVRLRSLAEKITSTISGEAVSHSPNPTSLQDQIIRLVEAEDDLNADIDRLVALKQEIAGVLKLLNDADVQLVLELRYLCFQPWSGIANTLGYHVRTVQRIHNRALMAVDEILKSDHYRQIHESCRALP